MATRRQETEEETYQRLHAKYGDRPARRRREPEPDDDEDDDGVFVFSGRRADSIVDRMFGPARAHDDDDQDDDDQDDDEPDDDPEPDRASNKFFRGRSGRG